MGSGNQKKYDLFIIREFLSTAFEESISRTRFQRLREVAGIPKFVKATDLEGACNVVAAAYLRRQSPKLKLNPLMVKLHLRANREQILADLSRSKSVIEPAAGSTSKYPDCVGWEELADLICDCRGRKPGASTLARWCADLGLRFSESKGFVFSGEVVGLLIQHHDQIKKRQEARANRLNNLRRKTA